MYKYIILLFFILIHKNGICEINDKGDNSIRIMSYNIRNGIDINGNNNTCNIIKTIKEVSPDILSLQEVKNYPYVCKDIIKTISSECLMYCSNANISSNDYDIAILSKEKPLNQKYIKLPDNKSLLIVEFGKYYVCNVQLSRETYFQIESIPFIFSAVKNINKPVFLTGNMNCNIISPSQIQLQTKFKLLSKYKQKTISVENSMNLPIDCIDFIYGYNIDDKTAVIQSHVLENTNSDHYPIFSDIRIPKKKQEIFTTEPYLQNPQNNSITICWETSVPCLSWVEYGENGCFDKKEINFHNGQIICNNFHHNFRLKNLKPGTTYNYRVCSQEIVLYEGYRKTFGNIAYSNVNTISIPNEDESNCTTLIFNDLHNNNTLISKFSEIIRKKKIEYDFTIFNGDCIDSPESKDDIINGINRLNKIAGKKPYFLIRGNHEIRGSYSLHLYSFFEGLSDCSYGAFNWGKTRFVFLDCGEDKPDSTWVYYGLNDFEQFRSNQCAFLENEKKSNEFKESINRILIHHIPIYAGDKIKFNPCINLWGDILNKMPFNIAINGHTHKFEFIEKNKNNNPFPVIIGGGNKPDNAYMIILKIKNKTINIEVLDINGNCILKRML